MARFLTWAARLRLVDWMRFSLWVLSIEEAVQTMLSFECAGRPCVVLLDRSFDGLPAILPTGWFGGANDGTYPAQVVSCGFAYTANLPRDEVTRRERLSDQRSSTEWELEGNAPCNGSDWVMR